MPERPKTRNFANDGRASVCGDWELVRRVKSGHTEAYGELVRRYQDRVFNTCWRICGHLEDARDLTQDAFLKAFESIGDFRQESGFYTWIFRVAVNLSLSHRRSTSRRRVASLEGGTAVGGTQAEDLARRVRQSVSDDPGQAASNSDLQGRVVHALQMLDDGHRAVVVLRDMEGLDYQQIGTILGIPPGTVKSRLHRARMALRAAMSPARSGPSEPGA